MNCFETTGCITLEGSVPSCASTAFYDEDGFPLLPKTHVSMHAPTEASTPKPKPRPCMEPTPVIDPKPRKRRELAQSAPKKAPKKSPKNAPKAKEEEEEEGLNEPAFSFGQNGRLEITAQSQTNHRVYLVGRAGLSKESAAEIVAAVKAAFEAGSPTKAEVKAIAAKLPSQP